MKALCIADIHGDREAITRLQNSLVDEDITHIFLMGDYSRGFKDEAENEHDILFILSSLNRYNIKAFPGNCDQKKSLEIFESKGISMHNSIIDAGDYAVIGFGGSNPTPFETPFEITEEEIYDNLRRMIENTRKKDKKVILLTHAPPKDTKCDEIPGGVHVGSKGLRSIIEEYQPVLSLSSHIHESGGREDKIGKTRVMNVGRLSDGRAILLDVSKVINAIPYTG